MKLQTSGSTMRLYNINIFIRQSIFVFNLPRWLAGWWYITGASFIFRSQRSTRLQSLSCATFSRSWSTDSHYCYFRAKILVLRWHYSLVTPLYHIVFDVWRFASRRVTFWLRNMHAPSIRLSIPQPYTDLSKPMRSKYWVSNSNNLRRKSFFRPPIPLNHWTFYVPPCIRFRRSISDISETALVKCFHKWHGKR